MASRYESANKRFMVSNEWLAEFSADTNAYIDLYEIKTSPATSSYAQWLLSQTSLSTAAQATYLSNLQTQADMSVNLIHVGNIDGGPEIRGLLANEIGRTPIISEYAIGEYWEEYRRIYANRTTARDIMFKGYAL